VKDIRTNPYVMKAETLWEANINIQFILDPYAATCYSTSYLTKIDKTITNEFQTIIKKCENENVDANLKIRKLGNVFFKCTIEVYSISNLYSIIFTFLSRVKIIFIF